MKTKQFLQIVFMHMSVLLTLASCGGKSDSPVHIHPLYRTLSEGNVPSDPASLRAARTLFEVSGYGELSDSSAIRYASMESIRYHLGRMDSVFPTLGPEEKSLGHVFGEFRRVFPDRPLPGVYAVVSPFRQSVFTVDTIMFVGLNHYLGADYQAYDYFPDYMRSRKVRERLPVDVAEVLVRTSWPYADDGGTVLSRIAYEGLVAVAVARLTGADAALTLGYDPQQMKWLSDNERRMWDTMVSRRMIFTHDPATARSLTAISPATTLITPEAPGGAGRYIGMRLTEAYLKAESGITLNDMFARRIYADPDFLNRASYMP